MTIANSPGTLQPLTGVTINGRFLLRQSTGVDRFASEILRAWLPTYGLARSARLVVPTHSVSAAPHNPGQSVMGYGRFGGHVWEQFELPSYRRSDVLINLCNTGPVFRRRQLVVLHDAAVMANPSSYSLAFRTWYRALFGGLTRRSMVVASVSHFAAAELTRYFGARASAIQVVYESGEHILRSAADPEILERLQLDGQPYILAVGSRSLNKNFGGVLKAAERLTDLGIKIVAAGGSDSRVFAGTKLSGDNVVLAGYVTDGELRALYENARCFVFPSFYEGFGLPPLEAMHCGCPVIVSRRASLPEICGEAAVYCDPDDPKDIADCIRRVLSSESLQKELREAGFERTTHFTWAGAANRLEKIIASNFDSAKASCPK